MQPNQLKALTNFTFVVPLVYAPIETWASTLLAIGALAWSIAIAARTARQPIEPQRV